MPLENPYGKAHFLLCVSPLLVQCNHAHNPSDTRWVGFPYLKQFCNTLGVLQFNSVLTISAWSWHQIPQVKGSVPQDVPNPLPRCHSRIQAVYLCFCRPAVNQRFQTPWFNYFAREAHRTQENSYLLDDWFIIKGHNSGTARWKKSIGQGWGMGAEFPCCLPASHSPRISTCPPRSSLNAVPFGFYGGFIT